MNEVIQPKTIVTLVGSSKSDDFIKEDPRYTCMSLTLYR